MDLLDLEKCPLCGAAAKGPLAIGGGRCRAYRCANCGVEFARYSPGTTAGKPAEEDHFQGINLDLYQRSVQATRERSYNALFPRVKRFLPSGKWLDVGCSYGWLLRRAAREGFSGFGVEPSPGAAAEAQKNGLAVSAGLFPQTTGTGAPYDVVSFMDVLEHLPKPAEVLQQVKSVLRPEGLLVLQVPDQTCLLYGLAKTLGRTLHLDFALRRLWLVDFAFPHLFYFNRSALTRLLQGNGFEVVDFYRAPIGDPREAFSRVNYVQSRPGLGSMLVAGGVAAINLLDILWSHGGLMVVLARRRANP